MTLATLARRLNKSHLHKSLLLINHLPSQSSPYPPNHPREAFHQTPLIPSYCPLLYTHYFSTLQPFSAQHLTDPFGLNVRIQDPDDVVLVRFLELLERVVELPSKAEAMAALDESFAKVDHSLVYSAIWAMKDQWRLSFLAFKWGERQGFVDEKTCNSIIWVLGTHRKFNTAWCLIREMHRFSMDTRQAMLIMIDRYAFANNPSEAIRTFQFMEAFRLTLDQATFLALLNSLCIHGNMEEAEEFMLLNKKFYPLSTESFNIILNGWSNISTDISEAKRVWREMSKCCITPNSISHTHMISCFSKVGNLFDSLRLFDEMKKRGFVPDLEVYNSLIYVLTRENCINKALNILNKITDVGLKADPTTYNSMICPLCEAKKMDSARDILNMMIEENIAPTMETYHAFLEGESFEGTFEVLGQMRKAGLGPSERSFLIILRKLFKLEQPEIALKIWVQMKQCEVFPNSEHYEVMVQGLLTCGWLNKAREIHDETKSNGFIVDPKVENLLNGSERGKSNKKRRAVRRVRRDNFVNYRKCSKMRRTV